MHVDPQVHHTMINIPSFQVNLHRIVAMFRKLFQVVLGKDDDLNINMCPKQISQFASC